MNDNLIKSSSEKKLRESVSDILRRVRDSGDSAVSIFTRKFDGVTLAPKDFRVDKSAISSSAKRLTPDVKKAIDLAARRVKFFARKQLEIFSRASWRAFNPDGVIVGEMISPVETAAIYIPGGRYPYPSTVLMTAIPARVARVKRVYIMTPPKGISDEVLYAASVAGVTEIYRVGGVQAIGAAAYGTKMIPKADIIVGPGNKYVAEAKRQVFGDVGIDMVAGPSEVAIIADGKAPPEWVCADLAAQAEHDPDAVCWLFSDSKKLIHDVLGIVDKKYKKYKPQFRIKKVSSLDEACQRVSDEVAPEHLEMMVRDAEKYLKKIRNVGAVFAGYYTPTSLGDYCAGPSHVLPTGRSARFSSGLSVGSFLKKISVVMSAEKTSRWVDVASTLARQEGLENHRLSSELRRKKF